MRLPADWFMQSAFGSHDGNFFSGQRSNVAFSLEKLCSVLREDHRYGEHKCLVAVNAAAYAAAFRE
jgi:hypothetical protein